MNIMRMQGVCHVHQRRCHLWCNQTYRCAPSANKSLCCCRQPATCDMPTTLHALGAAGRTQELSNAQEQVASQSREVHSLQAKAAELTQAKHDLLQQLEQHQQDLALKAGQHAELQTAHEQVTSRCTELEKQVEQSKQRTAGLWQDSLVCVIYVSHGMQIHALLGCYQV